MKIINRNTYNVMYGMEFINAGEVKEIADKEIIKMLLKQPNIEEYADIKDMKAVEEENKKLKEKLVKAEKDKIRKQLIKQANKEKITYTEEDLEKEVEKVWLENQEAEKEQ